MSHPISSGNAETVIAIPLRGLLRFLLCLPGLAIWSIASALAIGLIWGLGDGSVTPGVESSALTLYVMWSNVVVGAITAFVCALLTAGGNMRLSFQPVIALAGLVALLMTIGD